MSDYKYELLVDESVGDIPKTLTLRTDNMLLVRELAGMPMPSSPEFKQLTDQNIWASESEFYVAGDEK